MNIKVDRIQLIEKLKAKEKEFETKYNQEVADREKSDQEYAEYQKLYGKALGDLVKEALRRGAELSLDSYYSDRKKVTIQLRDIDTSSLPYAPKRANTPNKSSLSGIRTQIMKLEMSSQDVISVSDKDNYFMYLV